ncbi:3',5'-cyclic AMP phosphodiesterase CpdA [Azospirillaceae bacterium]
MRIVAHISDLHFGRIDPKVVEGLEADLAWRSSSLSMIVISGDLVQRPGHKQFQAARAFLERLPVPFLVVPGNHDIPVYNLFLRFYDPYRRYRRYVSHDLSPIHIDSEIAILGLSTARALNLNFAHGRINKRQVARIHDVFDAAPSPLFKILVTHHPFLPPPDAPNTRLVGRSQMALTALERCGVDLVLSGHLHRSFSGDVAGHHAFVQRSILVAQAATATSTRLRRDPNGYNVISIAFDEVTIEERAWNGCAFECDRITRYRREGDHWRVCA